MKKNLVWVVGVGLFFFLIEEGRSVSAGTLDGRTFELRISDQKKESCSREHAYFLNGHFESMECRQYGFKKAPYTTETTKAGIAFKSVVPSSQEGTNTWTGVVVGTTIAGTLLWEKTGQDPILYHYEGNLLPLAKWPMVLQKSLNKKE
jgi:hypothetical protein